MTLNALPAATVEAAVEAHGSLRAAARALGRPESTLRGILKRAQADDVEHYDAHNFGGLVHPEDTGESEVGLAPVTADAVAADAEAKAAMKAAMPNRATRRAMRSTHPHFRRARRMTRPLRRAFGGWSGAYRPTPWGRV